MQLKAGNSLAMQKRSRIALGSNIICLCARVLVWVANTEVSTDLKGSDWSLVLGGLATAWQLMVLCWLGSTQIRNKNIFLQIQMEKCGDICVGHWQHIWCRKS